MYDQTKFQKDLVTMATTMHASYRRGQLMLDRWNNGMNNVIPNSGDGVLAHNLMNRVSEMVSDYEANNNAKLNTIISLSAMTLSTL